MTFACPFCTREMVRHENLARLLVCPECQAMGTANVLHAHRSHADTLQHVLDVLNVIEVDRVCTRAMAVNMLREALRKFGGVR